MDFSRPIEALIPGARGEILGAMILAGREMSTAEIGRLAGVSGPQASRVLAQLVELGVAERREVPPAVIYRPIAENVVVQLLTKLCEVRRSVVQRCGTTAAALSPRPVELGIYGSVARGTSGPQSDIDVLVVRPDGADDDDRWVESLDAWRREMSRFAGSPVSLLEVSEEEWRSRDRTSSLWAAIDRDLVRLIDAPIGALR